MRSWILTAVPLALLALVSLALVSGCGQLFAEKVVSVGENELTVAKGEQDTPTTHEVAPDAEVVLNGDPAALDDIRPGDAVRLTTEKQGERELVVKIEATRPQEEHEAERADAPEEPQSPTDDEPALPPEGEPQSPFAEAEPLAPFEEEAAEFVFPGVITRVSDDQIHMLGDPESDHPAEEMIFQLTDETEITVGGEPAGKEDLVDGMVASVTAERDGDDLVAKRIDAKPVTA
jgi:hypothetical protein